MNILQRIVLILIFNFMGIEIRGEYDYEVGLREI